VLSTGATGAAALAAGTDALARVGAQVVRARSPGRYSVRVLGVDVHVER
jgi:hypothetical protein